MAADSPTPLANTWLPLRGPFARWPRAADAGLAVFVFLWSVFVADGDDTLAVRAFSDVPPAAVFFYALGAGALYWRRQRPLAVLGVSLLVLVALTAMSFPNSVWSMPFALYAVGRYAASDRWSYAGLGAALALATVHSLVEGDSLSDMGFGSVFIFMIWYIGRYLRVRGNYLRLLEERAAQLEREQDSEARRAVADERTRIARELHDVVAHRVSLMTVQAGAAKTVVADDPQSSVQAMEAVENAGRQALDELRHLLGVLRPESEASGLGPQPGLADVPRLVQELREADLDVSLTMDDTPEDLPARVALSAYRIIQEALTNVLKHAGPDARTEIRLGVDNEEIAIEITDNGRGASLLPGSGHGIVGMRERAQLLGGRLDARPRPGGGFKVVARLPMGANSQ